MQSNNLSIRNRIVNSITGLGAVFLVNDIAQAQDARTAGDSLAIPVFEQVDQNGVDLLSGRFTTTSPILSTGENRTVLGLHWTGQSWSVLGFPTISLDKNNHFFVNYIGYSDEFLSFDQGLAQIKPQNGAKLNCSTYFGYNQIYQCKYVSRDGDVVFFGGTPPRLLSNTGFFSPHFGNLSIYNVIIFSKKGYQSLGGPYSIGESFSSGYRISTSLGPAPSNLVCLNLAAALSGDPVTQFLAVTGGSDYLRPNNTIQTISDSQGSTWEYTVNSNRLITKIKSPGNVADVTIVYDGNKRVGFLTSASGTWSYSYTRSGILGGNNGTTTVTDPQGRKTYLEYDTKKGRATLVRDPLLRQRTYNYDVNGRLTSLTYPEGNRVEITYDERGNVTQRKVIPKLSAASILIETANFDTICVYDTKCNKPNYIIDSNGNRTDIEYDVAPPEPSPAMVNINGSYTIPAGTYSFHNPISSVNFYAGSGQPSKIKYPAPLVGGQRQEVINTYVQGHLQQSRYCKTMSNCGAADLVLTDYEYGNGWAYMLFGMTVSASGQTMRTCYTYDGFGRRISETFPRADLTSCPKTVVIPPSSSASFSKTEKPETIPPSTSSTPAIDPPITPFP